MPQIKNYKASLAVVKLKVREYYGMFHVTWSTCKFNRNQLGTVSGYVMSSVPWSNQCAH